MRTALRAAVLAATLSVVSGPGGRVWAQEGLKPAPARKAYEVRTIRVGDTYQGIRFKPATGETWQLAVDKWQPLAEAGAVPAGDYDVILIPTEETFLGIRVDRTTGATWLLRNRKWAPVKEPPAPAKPDGQARANDPGGYELRHTRVKSRLYLLRFHTRTGVAAVVQGDGYEFQGETGAVPVGDFDVTMIADEKQWMAVRADRSTGATWLLQANQWNRVAEPK